MNKGIIFLSITLLLSFTLVAAINLPDIDVKDLSFKQMECMTILPFKGEVIGQELPSEVPVSNEIINIYIDEEVYGFIQIEERVVTDFDCYEKEEATYDLFIAGESTISDIVKAEDPVNMLLEKLDNGEVELKGKTFTRKIKAFFVKIGVKWFA